MLKKLARSAAKVWGGVTGKNKFDEATKKYDRLKARYEKRRKKYDLELDEVLSSVKASLDRINQQKQTVYDDHLERFGRAASRLHNVRISGEPFEELFNRAVLGRATSSGVRLKPDVFTIDFDNLSAKEVALGILTLGFTTRKAAKQTLKRVEEEEARMKEEFEKLNSHLRKVKVNLEAIRSVEDHFHQLMNGYNSLLVRFERDVDLHSLVYEGFSLDSNARLDFRQLPIAVIERFHALFNLSIVLKAMSAMGYMSESGELQAKDIDDTSSLVARSLTLLPAAA